MLLSISAFSWTASAATDASVIAESQCGSAITRGHTENKRKDYVLLNWAIGNNRKNLDKIKLLLRKVKENSGNLSKAVDRLSIDRYACENLLEIIGFDRV